MDHEPSRRRPHHPARAAGRARLSPPGPSCWTCGGTSAIRTAAPTTPTRTCRARCSSTSRASCRRRRPATSAGTRCRQSPTCRRPRAAGACSDGRAGRGLRQHRWTGGGPGLVAAALGRASPGAVARRRAGRRGSRPGSRPRAARRSSPRPATWSCAAGSCRRLTADDAAGWASRRACCSTPGRASGTAARSNRSIRGRAISRARATPPTADNLDGAGGLPPGRGTRRALRRPRGPSRRPGRGVLRFRDHCGP